ncbi:MAG: tRNA (N6-threonylcarbamoyladenosine(37)-N6)-methyltransferase TrmO [Clostridia bacterium]|nr:tRNA (N6-threonylcarbamoyladenosine(37)-N6)-methyltransferase TrmO [Clostridia bacterium]
MRLFRHIAHIENDYTEKFGIPRQSQAVPELVSRIVFEPEYRDPSALRGLDEFSHLWLIWEFSASVREDFSPTVRPPKLGGNERVGVFATRSPFRPNPVGLSCVLLDRIEPDEGRGMTLLVRGADLMNGTPIYDIKPYLPYADAWPQASAGFTQRIREKPLTVVFDRSCHTGSLSEERLRALTRLLSLDPRPGYQDDPDRVYGLTFAGMNIRFTVAGDTLTVLSIQDPER